MKTYEDFWEFHYYGTVTDRNEVSKDCRCHECRNWFETTMPFFDEEENREYELCDECMELYN